MKQRYESAPKVAEFLLQIKAVKLQPQSVYLGFGLEISHLL
jgi:hypothetical protein